jgi:hypothetical protein
MTVSEGSTHGEGAFAVTPQVHDMTAHRQRLPRFYGAGRRP